MNRRVSEGFAGAEPLLAPDTGRGSGGVPADPPPVRVKGAGRRSDPFGSARVVVEPLAADDLGPVIPAPPPLPPPLPDDDTPVGADLSVAPEPADRPGVVAAIGRIWGERPAPAGPLIDAWHGSFSEVPTLTLVRDEITRGQATYLKLFPGVRDDRRPVRRPDPPWHGVCGLVITAANGSRWCGSGWLAGPRTVVTAGHCVFLTRHGGWARRVEVRLPGRAEPVAAVAARTTAGWADSAWREHTRSPVNYGAVLLPEPVDLPHRAYATADPGVRPEYPRVAVAGYCSDRPGQAVFAQSRTVRETQPRLLVYQIPVFGGVSGSPVFPLADGADEPAADAPVVGLQQDGDLAGGTAVRITPAVARNLAAWVAGG